jgi:nucleoside-diphosphate-sugar epimerase
MNILVTGSSGFIGVNLVKHLKDHNIKEVSIRFNNKINIITDEIDIIIHLAGKAHDLKKTSKPNDYYEANFELTKFVYNDFINSKAKYFIFISSIKALTDKGSIELTEDMTATPKTHYGISKRLAEEYIISQNIPQNKKYFILRPCMIHGPHNKGNLNLLYNVITNRVPWPLGSFENRRSFCSIDNLLFIIKELIDNNDIASGIYNVSDDEPLSTNEVISIIAKSQSRTPIIWKLPQILIKLVAKVGDVINFPLDSERLNKLTESYVVNNNKIKNAIGKSLPISAKEGLLKTFQSFKSKIA